MIAPLWCRAWVDVVPFFAFPPAIRRMIYTTNIVENLNRSLRKVIKTRGSFPSDEAELKLLYLARGKAPVHDFVSDTVHGHGTAYTVDRTLLEIHNATPFLQK